MTRRIAIRTEQTLNPTAIDVIRRAKQEALGDAPMGVDVYEADEVIPSNLPVLVLGKGEGDVNTLSVAQITNKESAITDLAQAFRLITDTPEHVELDYEVVDRNTPILLGSPIVVDIETSGDIKTDLPGEVDILSVAVTDGKRTYVIPQELVKKWARDILEDRELIAHNAQFDMRYLNAGLDPAARPLYADHDTMLMHYAMNHGAKSHGLKELARKFFNAPEWEAEAKKYTKGGAHYENIPRDLLYRYNAYDVYWTFRLYKLLWEQLEQDPPRRKLYLEHLMPTSHMLQDISTGGVGVDVALLHEMDARLEGAVADELNKLRSLTKDEKFNPGSWQQVKRHMEAFGHPVTATDEATLTKVRRDLEEGSAAYKFIDALLEYRGLAKLRSTYVQGILKRQRDGIVYPEFLVHGTTTGRLSSKSPNIQNLGRPAENDPYPIRKAIVATRPDYVVASTDYSQIELRALAEISNDEAMIAAFQPGAADYFDLMMPGAFPTKFETLEDFYEYKKTHPDGSKNLRALVKGVQYGLNYGRSVPAIAEALELSVEEAQEIVSGIFTTYPGLGAWQQKVRRAVTDDSLAYLLETPFNRRFQSEIITYRNKNAVQNAALAFTPQSTASDICVVAAREIHKRIGRYQGRITALVHDAVYYEGPSDRMEDLTRLVETEMIGAAASYFKRVKFEVETNIGANWMEV